MKSRKKIDDIYKEKFLNLETPPPGDVWEKISANLPDKEKKRILPFWYKLAGIAAAFLLIFLLIESQTHTIEGPSISSPGNAEEKHELHNDDLKSKDFEESIPQSTSTLEENIANTKISGSDSGNASSKTTGRTLPKKDNINPRERMMVAKNKILTPRLIPHPIRTEPLIFQTDTFLAEVESFHDFSPDFEEDPIEKKLKVQNRFSISTSTAAVYFGNLSDGNFLDNQFADKDAGSDISIAYGITIGYQISEKIKIRSGLNKVNFNYETQNVDLFSVINSQVISAPENAGSINNGIAEIGDLSQGLGFLEVPFEIEYSVLKSKIGVTLIGGFSSLFLNENQVEIKLEQQTTNLGEAQNLNNLSFSGNLGVGFLYNFSNKFEMNFEPIFKYQFNTFQNSSGLNPYYFGIYSGIRYNF